MIFTKYDKQKTRFTRLLNEYSNQVLNNDKFNWIKLKNVYNKSIPNNYAEYHLKRITRQPAFQKMIIEKIEEIYKKQGIDAETIIKEEQSILNDAKEAKNLKIRLDVVNNWRESLDLKPAKQQQITTTETNYLQLLSKDKAGTKQITAKQVKQLPNTEAIEEIKPEDVKE